MTKNLFVMRMLRLGTVLVSLLKLKHSDSGLKFKYVAFLYWHMHSSDYNFYIKHVKEFNFNKNIIASLLVIILQALVVLLILA